MQSRHMRSSGSPNASRSRSGGVLPVLTTSATLVVEQADGYVALVDALGEAVGGVRREDAVDPALHDGRRRAPAVGMDDGQKIAVAQFGDVLADQRIGRGLTARLGGGQAWIEAFLDQIVEPDLAARRRPRLPDLVRDGAAKASGSGMADDDAAPS